MIEENLQNEINSRRFLLDEMPEDERTAFEEKFIADEDAFEQMRVVEDELIESYTRGTLSNAEKEKFERSFLTTERRRQKVAFTRTMLDKLAGQKESVAAKNLETAAANPSVWEAVTNFFKTPKLAFGAAFALLILASGFWFLIFKSPQKDLEIVRQNTPTPAIQTVEPNRNQSLPGNQNVPVNSTANITEENSANKTASPNANRETPNKNQNSNSSKQESIAPSPVLALFAGTVRSNGVMPELKLPKNAPGANLQLNMESQDYKIYRVEIVDPDGRLVWRNNNLAARNSKVNLFIPAAKLSTGDYLVKLSARNPNNETESVADYTFRVSRR